MSIAGPITFGFAINSTAVYAAAAGGHAEVLDALLDAGGSANAVELWGFEGIFRRYAHGMREVSHAPIEDPLCSTSALFAASKGGYARCVKRLLRKGASVQTHPGQLFGRFLRYSPLQVANSFNYSKTVAHLTRSKRGHHRDEL